MRCPLCGLYFSEDEATCRGCLLGSSCRLMRCPNCGYEIPKEPKLVKVLRDWRRRFHGAGRKS